VIDGGSLKIRAVIASPDGRSVVRGEQGGPVDAARSLGESLADEMLARGGAGILEKLRLST